MQLLYIVGISILLSACAAHKDLQTQKIEEIEYITDLKEIPQDVSLYSKVVNNKRFNLENFEKEYFRVWNLERVDISLEDAMWSYKAFRYGDCYGENLQLLKQDFFDQILKNSNFDKYATLNKRALSLKELNIRAFPTEKPVLRDPQKAGEGFPFDYMQNSLIAANKPLLISHYSQDKKWAFIESSFAFGWVKTDDIVVIEKKYTDIWQNAQEAFIVKDGVPIYSEKNTFLYKSRIGMLFAIIKEDRDSFKVLTVTKDENSQAIYMQSKLSKEIAHKGVIDFNSENINAIISQLSQTKYGWGGLYGQRDCSSTLRDFYTPFGFWLPRNSFSQSQVGEIYFLEDLNDTQKIALIKEKAIPFETLLYKKGHIVLYVGTFNEKIIIFQNVWGVKTQNAESEGRFIIGKPVFSTLEIGSNLKEYDENSSLLKNLKSFNNIGE